MASTSVEEPIGSAVVETYPSMAIEEEETIGSAVLETSPSMAIEAKLTLDCQKLKDLLKDNATTMAMDAKLMVSTSHEECQKLKNKKEAKVMVLAMVSNKNQAPEAKPCLTSLQVRFLAAASEADLKGLNDLLSRTGDVEEGNNVPTPSPSATSLLESVTMEGDTALHLVAANGNSRDCQKFERCAKFILEKEKSLLSKTNNKGDTPLHCAARAGISQLVSCLIGLAKDDNGKEQDLLRMINNNNETALHEAIRSRDKEMVKVLLRADRELALFPTNGTSPLYLTIMTINESFLLLHKEGRQTMKEGSDDLLNKNKEKSMAQILHDESKDYIFSYLGPNGQNALHAAVLRGPALTRKLLGWNKDLTTQRDENGSTPLHFAAGLHGSMCSQVFNANPDALFQPDNKGLYPIHVAASVGAFQAIALFVKKRPSSAGLRDAKGRTFLHVAIENKQVLTITGFIVTRSLQARIMNMQDNDGNTALHLAVKSMSLRMFCDIFSNPKVHLNISNAKGQTPLDIAEFMMPPGELILNQNSEVLIRYLLGVAGACSGASRLDHFREDYKDIHGLKFEHARKELEMMKDMTQTTSIAAVLIATVAFGASFALPGGYRADDHINGGTPTLVGRYAFDGFMMANTLAFIFSTGTVLCIVQGGSPIYNRNSRIIYLGVAYYFMQLAVTCFIAAFALGAFVVLSPVARRTANAICIMTPFILLCNQSEFWLKQLHILRPFLLRKGLLWTSCRYIVLVVMNIFVLFWPFLLIFVWPARVRSNRISEVEPHV